MFTAPAWGPTRAVPQEQSTKGARVSQCPVRAGGPATQHREGGDTDSRGDAEADSQEVHLAQRRGRQLHHQGHPREGDEQAHDDPDATQPGDRPTPRPAALHRRDGPPTRRLRPPHRHRARPAGRDRRRGRRRRHVGPAQDVPGRRCRWVFYDHARNRTGVWCRMAECGNRRKVREHRSRQKSTPAS
ncbi:CGNR zinc finger domain-containing protein [Micromonospora nigra]|uniref:CGNR zinc finger domain-containing protein n=1 Tax=Micromonospora nigra TaxID=145857 RepID=UPI000B8174B4